MPKGYTSKLNIENYLLITIDPSFDSQVDSWIEDIESFIDEVTGRNFIADANASARLFSGTGEQELLIDDCVEIETLETGNDQYGDNFTVVDNNQGIKYLTLPENALDNRMPIKSLVLRHSVWNSGIKNHRITAKWGWSVNCPGDIVMVATTLVAHIYKFGRGGISDGVKSERIGNYSVSYQSDKDVQEFNNAMAVLNKYKKYEL